MSFIDINVEDVEERQAVEPGEYTLTIRSVEHRHGDRGDYLVIRMSIDGRPDAKMVVHTIFLPHPEDDAERQLDTKLSLKRFLTAVGYDSTNGIETEALVGLKCNAILTERDDQEYGTQNRIRRFLSVT